MGPLQTFSHSWSRWCPAIQSSFASLCQPWKAVTAWKTKPEAVMQRSAQAGAMPLPAEHSCSKAPIPSKQGCLCVQQDYCNRSPHCWGNNSKASHTQDLDSATTILKLPGIKLSPSELHKVTLNTVIYSHSNLSCYSFYSSLSCHLCLPHLQHVTSPTSIVNKITPLCFTVHFTCSLTSTSKFLSFNLILFLQHNQLPTGKYAVFFHQSPLKVLQHLLNWVSNLTKNMNC